VASQATGLEVVVMPVLSLSSKVKETSESRQASPLIVWVQRSAYLNFQSCIIYHVGRTSEDGGVLARFVHHCFVVLHSQAQVVGQGLQQVALGASLIHQHCHNNG